MEGSSNVLRKGAWTSSEDNLLRQCIHKYGEGKWHQVPLRAGLNRCRKSCRLRWLNYLKPTIKRGKLSSDEVDLVLRLHRLLGNRWSLIAGRLPGRTANDVKNYWNTHLSKKHEAFCKIKMKRKQNDTVLTKPVKKIDVIKPTPRSFSVNNGSSHFNGKNHLSVLPKVHVNHQCLGLNNNNNNNNSNNNNNNNNNNNSNNITCNKDKELVNNLADGDINWLENLLEESHDVDGLVQEVPATEKGATMPAFDLEQLWNMFEGDFE